MTVLIVDDEEAIRSAIGRFFTRLGFRVIQAEDGAAALEPGVIPGGVPDLLITDVRMPRMNGIELANRLRGLSPRLPVVFVTGFANPDLGPLAAEGAAPVVVIRKPFDLSDLAARARRLLDESRAAAPGAESPAA
jgi:DNA-binding response OmpR family regulator